MDPPSYGRGKNGEVWNIEDSLYTLVELCTKVLSDKPLFFIINSYTTGLAPTILANILNPLDCSIAEEIKSPVNGTIFFTQSKSLAYANAVLFRIIPEGK